MKKIAFKRLSVPSIAILVTALLYLTCVVLVSQSALRAKLQRSIESMAAAGLSKGSDNDWFLWKNSDQINNNLQKTKQQQEQIKQADKYSFESDNNKGNDGLAYTLFPQTENSTSLESVPLIRLEGWPTEFPDDLDEYRSQVLSNSTWTSPTEKHKAEIAPWVWHHRGQADILSELAKSSDANKAAEAAREMARLGITPAPEGRRANASFVVLLRNRELDQFRATIRQLEDRFNRRYHYPYLLLNDEPFTDKFMRLVAASTTSNVTFATIPHDHWSVPDFIDEEKAAEARRKMQKSKVIYGGSLSYRHMCRYNSGFFYKHPLLRNVDWYWRVEPGVDFYCDIDYDPFLFMQDNGKQYSFVIALKELEATIPSLWQTTLEYMQSKNISSNLMPYFVDETGNYNLCHFWSNFEIASLNWLRSDAYESYFQYLDQAKGFFIERWGDAPVHSIAAGMLLTHEQVHFFDDIGYRHDNFMHCPDVKHDLSMDLKCQCPQERKNFDNSEGSCLPRWKSYVPYRWTQRDTDEALRLMGETRIVNAQMRDPKIVKERRRWYNFFTGF